VSLSFRSERNRKAGLSGLFCFGPGCRRILTGTFLIALSPVAVAEPLTIEVTTVSPGLDEQTKRPYISFQMTAESAKRFGEFTTKNVGRPMEIRIDGKTVMTPVIREPILGGSGQVSDPLWTLRQTQDLVDRLSAGKAKIEFEIVKE
jgi:preprotein translocase subunit SecD